jgi:hypothetical protein
MPSIGNKIRAAVQPLERWRLAITGQPLHGSDSVGCAVQSSNDDTKRTFTWDDVDMVMGALQVMTTPGAIHGANSVPFVPMNWDAHLWHIAEKIASTLPPRDEPPHEGLGYGVNQLLANYEVGFDGKPWTPTEHPSKATRARNCLLGGIAGDWHHGKVGHATHLTLFTLEGLLRAITRANLKGICHPPTVVFNAYRRWHRTRLHPMVAGTLDVIDGWLAFEPALHGEVRAGATTWAVIKSESMGTPDEPVNASYGSDAVARAAPAGFLNEDSFSLGAEIAFLTHGHLEAMHAAGAFAVIIHFLVRGSPLEFGVRQAVLRLESERSRDLAVRLCDAFLWGRQRPEASAVAERYPGPRRAGDALCLAVLSAASALDGRSQIGEGYDGPESVDAYSSGSRSVRSMRGQMLGAIRGGVDLPNTELGRDLTRIVDRLSRDVETGFRDGDEWWRAYPGW